MPARGKKEKKKEKKKSSEIQISFTVKANMLFQTTVCMYSLCSPTAETANRAWQMA